VIRALYRTAGGEFCDDLPADGWPAALQDAGGVLWVDFGQEAVDVVEPVLRDIFGFHPLAIDDALRESHVPKIDNWGDYAYAVVHGARFNGANMALEVDEIDVFLGRNYLVTHHTEPAACIDRLWRTFGMDPRRVERGADFLLYDLLDMLAADYMPLIDSLDDALDELEDEIFERPSQHTLTRLFQVKRVALQMRRILAPQREVLNRLARDDYVMIDAKDRIYFRDVYDHFVRLADINEGLRDLISGTLDTYLSVTSNRINAVMKVLTILSALFMPLAFLSGFFGMNFTGIAFDEPWLLALALALMVLTPAGMFAWFKRQGWM
jgi:magnesium transporter